MRLSNSSADTAYDFKKQFKTLYSPPTSPSVIDVPAMRFVAMNGSGDPNDPDGEYASAIEVLYSISYTIKMSYMSGNEPDGYFKYVVPPLEGLWWTDSRVGITGTTDKSSLKWVSMIRLPEFVTEDVFRWACDEAESKKGISSDGVKMKDYTEGLCVQCMHVGGYDDEKRTMDLIEDYMVAEGYAADPGRMHHEIYLGDPRKVSSDRLKTVLRRPVKKIGCQ